MSLICLNCGAPIDEETKEHKPNFTAAIEWLEEYVTLPGNRLTNEHDWLLHAAKKLREAQGEST